MIKIIEYDTKGEIIATHMTAQGMLKSYFINNTLTVGASAEVDSSRNYIVGGTVNSRPRQEINVEGLSIFSIANGTDVFVDGEHMGSCETGTLTIEKENPSDTVSVRLSLFPYIDKEITL